MSDFLVTVRGPRAEDFERVFGSATVRVILPWPERFRLPDGRIEPCYLLDVLSLRTDERTRLVAHLSEQFGLPESEITGSLEDFDVPIVAKDADITILNRQFLLPY